MKEKNNQFIHLAIAFDKNYLNQFMALSASVFHNNPLKSIYLHTITSGLSKQEEEYIEKYYRSNNSVIKKYKIDETKNKSFKTTGNWSSAVYYRLYFPLLISPEVERLLYIDADTLVVGDLQELYNIDMGLFPVAAIYDNHVKKQELIGINEGNYFNSGVLLINIKIWNEQEISEKSFKYLLRNPNHILYVDQCALNAVLKDNWLKIENKYNHLHSYVDLTKARNNLDSYLSDKIILHFTLQRPWLYLSTSPFKKIYAKYGKSTGYGKFKAIIDFSLDKVPYKIKQIVTEFYLESTLLKYIWQSLKQLRK